MGGMSRGRDDIWGLILLSEAWWTAPCGGRRAADEGRRLAAPPRGLADRPGVPRMLGGIWGCILFKLKEYTPRPLLRPKEGLRPFLWKPSRRVRGVSVTKDVGTGDGGGGIVGIRGFSPCGGRGWGRLGSFGAGIGWLLPCEGTGGGTPGSSCPTGGRGKTSSTTLDGVRRRSRLAARRMVGATGRRRQRNGGFRPSSSVLGKFQEGAGAPSWFPALAAERMKSFFPATCAAGKILLTERSVGAPPFGGTPAPERSAQTIVRPAKGRAHRVGGI